MRILSRCSAVLLVSTFFTPAFAADINQAGADDIARSLTKYVPQKIIDTGFLKVTPGSNRYELVVDLQALIDHYKPQEFSIAGLKPFVHFLTPQENGLWRIEANQSLDATASFGKGKEKVDVAYKVDSMMFDGMFDPSISYFSEARATAPGFRIDSRSATETMSATGGAMEQVLTTRKLSDTHVTFDSSGTIADYAQTITSGATDNFVMKADKVAFDVRFENFGIGPFKELVVFILDKAYAGKDKLTAEEGQQLRAILKANLPFGDLLKEKITFSNLSVEAQGMRATVEEIGYAFDFNGVRRDTRFGIDFSASKPVIPPGMLPPGSEEALPETIGLGFAVTNLNLADAATYFLDHADFSANEPLTPTESAEIQKIILPDGKIHIEFRNIYARSNHYDIDVSGTMVGDAGDSNRFSADMTIYARNLDGTIAFLQKNAGAIPEFGQAAFGAQMLKGFAKQEADGRFSWNFVISEDGKMKVNGQDFPPQ